MKLSPERQSSQPDNVENRPEGSIRESVSKADMQAIQSEGTMSATRSASGPGGQNVNKTAKTAEFRWTPADSIVLNEVERSRIIAWMQKNKPSQLVGDNEIYITSVENKSLDANKKAVLKNLHKYLTEAFKVEARRIPTRPSRGVRERRLAEKKAKGLQKKLRGPVVE